MFPMYSEEKICQASAVSEGGGEDNGTVEGRERWLAIKV